SSRKRARGLGGRVALGQRPMTSSQRLDLKELEVACQSAAELTLILCQKAASRTRSDERNNRCVWFTNSPTCRLCRSLGSNPGRRSVSAFEDPGAMGGLTDNARKN